MSNLTSWPILRTPGASSSGFRSASASASAIWPRRRPPPPNRSSAPDAVADRDVAGLARRDRQGDAERSACIGSIDEISASIATTPCLMRPRDPGGELRRPSALSRRPSGRSAERASAARARRGRRARSRRGRPATGSPRGAASGGRAAAGAGAPALAPAPRSPSRVAPAAGADKARVWLDRRLRRRRRFRRRGG